MARLYVDGLLVSELYDNWVAPSYKLSGVYDARKYGYNACLITGGNLPIAYVPSIIWGLGDHRDMNKSLEVTWVRVPITDPKIPPEVRLSEFLLHG